MTSLDKINIRQLIRLIKSRISTLVSYYFNDNSEIRESINEFLQGLKDKNSLVTYEIEEFKIRQVTWKEIYPKFFPRCMAQLAYLLKLPENTTPCLYTYIFPYKIRNTSYISDNFFQDGVNKEDVDDYMIDEISAVIKYKHCVYECKINIQPIQPIDKIEFIITKEKSSI